MNKITINGQEFEEISVSNPISNGVYYQNKWYKPTKPKFTFGGHEVSFKLIPSKENTKYSYTTVEVTCKGEIGANWQIEEILKNYFRPCSFGNVKVKGFTLKGAIDNYNTIPTIAYNDECSYINEIIIGCLTGTYKELLDIHNHCLTLLKDNS